MHICIRVYVCVCVCVRVNILVVYKCKNQQAVKDFPRGPEVQPGRDPVYLPFRGITRVSPILIFMATFCLGQESRVCVYACLCVCVRVCDVYIYVN